KMRARLLRFFFDGNGLSVRIKFHHAVPLRILHWIAENHRTLGQARRGPQLIDQSGSIENVVAENKTHRLSVDELAANQKRLGQATRFRLFRITQAEPPLAAVSQQVAKCGQIGGRTVYKKISPTRKQECR